MPPPSAPVYAIPDCAEHTIPISARSRHSGPGHRPRWRRWLFALLPLCLLLGGGELALRLVGWPPPVPTAQGIPVNFPDHTFVWYRDRELGGWFQVTADGQEVRVNPLLRSRGVHPLAFPLHVEGEIRLFALGGSTTYGEPYTDREWGFPQRLEGVLRERYPQHRWRVLNAGASGLDSRALPGLVAEILDLEPDGILVYAGHNEIRGELLDTCTEPFRRQVYRGLSRLAVFRGLRQSLLGPEPPPDIPTILQHQDDCMLSAVQAMDDWRRRNGRGGPSDDPPPDSHRPWLPRWPARNDPLYLQALAAYHDNLERVITLAERRGVPVWLGLPAVNLRYPPQRSMADPRLDDHQAHRLELDLRRADSLVQQGDMAQAQPLVDRALAEDETNALAHYLHGLLALEAGRPEEARASLQAAIDLDYDSPRITSHMLGVLRQLCQKHDAVRCVDVAGAFQQAAPQHIPGSTLFVDYCHPTFNSGVQLIADTFADNLDPALLGGG